MGPLRPLGNLRSDDRLAEQVTRASLERASLRILSRRYGKAKDTTMRIIHRVCAVLPDSVEVARRFRPSWSGTLVVDGKVVKVYDRIAQRRDHHRLTDDERRSLHRMRWLCGVDHGTGDLPHYALADEESRVDWVMYFRTLRGIGFPLTAVICDGNPEIPRAARFVYGPHVILQRCTRHFIEDLRRLLPAEPERLTERRELERLIVMIQRVIEADTVEEAATRDVELAAYAPVVRGPIACTMRDALTRTRHDLTTHLRHPELHLPHTSNDIENLFRQLNLRLKTLGRFMHQRYAASYLNAWALLRRFTPFTDCCRGRRDRNGKCPLQLAGVDTVHIEPLALRR